jgi:hypothetical protein
VQTPEFCRFVLVTTNGIRVQDDATMKAMLHRIVAMLTRMAMKFEGVAESSTEYEAEIDYDYEHRFAEHEHANRLGKPRSSKSAVSTGPSPVRGT